MLVWDTETDGLLDELTVIHCLHIKDRETGIKTRYSSGVYSDGSPARRDGTVEDGLRLLMDAEDINGHNIIGFDLKAVAKIYPWFKPKGRVHDTLVYSRLIWTDLLERDSKAIKQGLRPPGFIAGKLTGKHSLEAWGFRLGVFKGDYSQMKSEEARTLGLIGDEVARYVWATFNREMDDYCEQDVDGTDALYELILTKDYAPEALALEIEVAKIIDKQETHGFLFDTDKALALTRELTGIRAELHDRLTEVIHPWYEPERYKGGHVVLTPKVRNAKMGYQVGCPLTKVQLCVFNPGSRDHIANRMKALYNWIPTEMTEGGKPKVDETTLDGLPFPDAKLLVQYLTVQKRLGQLAEGDQALMKKVAADGRIHGRVNPNGARTGRMSHFNPNLANVPSVKLDPDTDVPLKGAEGGWGYECRDLFTVRPGHKLVGCDAEGLELRMLGHYLARFDDGAYSLSVVEGKKSNGTDVHSVNMRGAGLNSRANAKTFTYAYLYGAGNPKLGATVYEDFPPEQQEAFNRRATKAEAHARSKGQDPTDVRIKMLARLGLTARQSLESSLPALGKLQTLVKEKAKRGYLKGLDGRLLRNSFPHAALNTTLQGAGAVVMKLALVISERAYQALGWTHGKEYSYCANVHDEAQLEVEEAHAQEAGQIFADAIRLAGEHFKLRCPLSGAYQVGSTWAASH